MHQPQSARRTGRHPHPAQMEGRRALPRRGDRGQVRTRRPAPRWSGDPAELREMLTNLIFNAVDAMPQGGCITIRTTWRTAKSATLPLRHRHGHGRGNAPPLPGTVLHDQGRARHGPGTLGGVRHHRAPRRHDGHRERTGHGHELLHPAARRGARTRQPPTTPAASGAAADSSGIRRILVVDDQPIILELLQQQLCEDGHEVETANDGCEALEKLGAGRFDLLLTDQSMPGMTGEELAVAAREKYPQLAVILLTGFGGSRPGHGPRDAWGGHRAGQTGHAGRSAPGHRAGGAKTFRGGRGAIRHSRLPSVCRAGASPAA